MLKNYIKNHILEYYEAEEMFDQMVEIEVENDYNISGLWRGEA